MAMDSSTNQSEGGIEEAIKGLPVSRRWLLRNTANAAAGVIAVSTLGAGAAKLEAQPLAVTASSDTESHADRPAGYVHALHGWDTI
jgi:hypothetical protein